MMKISDETLLIGQQFCSFITDAVQHHDIELEIKPILLISA